jgi:isopropylmalate/homocitrate/citramalate synthase
LGGASTIQTTVNGLGEFTGLVPLEEFAVASEMHIGVPTGINLAELKSLSDFVARAIGVDLPVQKPAVGNSAFAIPETEEIQQVYWELYQEGRLEEGLTYPPRLVGNRYQMSIGRRCNTYTVLYNLANLGWTADAETVKSIMLEVRKVMAERSGYALMSKDEFRELVVKAKFNIRSYQNSDTATTA